MLKSNAALLRLMSLEQQEHIYQERTGDDPDPIGYWRRFRRVGRGEPPKEPATMNLSCACKTDFASPASDLNFAAVYAPDTTQHTPNLPGVFHFWLKRGFDSRQHPDGGYLLEVEASDVRGNPNS